LFYSVIDTWCLMVREHKGLLLGSPSVYQRRNKKNNNFWNTAKNSKYVSKYRRKFCPAFGSAAVVSVRHSLPFCFVLGSWPLMLYVVVLCLFLYLGVPRDMNNYLQVSSTGERWGDTGQGNIRNWAGLAYITRTTVAWLVLTAPFKKRRELATELWRGNL